MCNIYHRIVTVFENWRAQILFAIVVVNVIDFLKESTENMETTPLLISFCHPDFWLHCDPT